jgi:hypothetical protein
MTIPTFKCQQVVIMAQKRTQDFKLLNRRASQRKPWLQELPQAIKPRHRPHAVGKSIDKHLQGDLAR